MQVVKRHSKMKIIPFIKNWTLPISMVMGVVGYFVYTGIPVLAATKPFVNKFIDFVQPLLIFTMLFITFCKVDPHKLMPCKWHLWLLLFQALSFVLLSGILVLFPHTPVRVLIEGAMLCLICPTATAAAVVTNKLGESTTHLTSYIILINFCAALLVPCIIPAIQPNTSFTFSRSFIMIISKVFPLLFCPFLVAILVRKYAPTLHKIVLNLKDLAFYLWAISLSIAITITVKTIVHSTIPIHYQVGIAITSLFCCIIQFALGRKIGARYGESIGAGQSLGQKNTVFAIWMGYTFLTPVTAIAGGFYSIWHNAFNSYQLYQKRKGK